MSIQAHDGKGSPEAAERGWGLLTFALGLGLGMAILFGRVIAAGENFTWRDAGQFYYPLFQRIQQEWRAGRVPLWEPEENAGTPLLGNPATSVFYPGKLIFAILPFGLAYKWYILGHVLLAAVAAYLLARHWGIGRHGAALCGLSYGFGGPVMFQYCNVIFLVSAAWLPPALLAADRALRMRQWPWAFVLAVVLALMVLGGDPEAAYLSGGLAALYALLLLGAGASEAKQDRLRSARDAQQPARPQRVRSVRVARRSSLLPTLGMLATAATAACLLAAVQILPAAEFARLSTRAAGGAFHDPLGFSFEPWQAAGAVWPNLLGRAFPRYTQWINVLPGEHRYWDYTIYLGILPLVLALPRLRLNPRRAPSWQVLLSLMVILGFWAALGKYASPVWWTRLAHPPPVRQSTSNMDPSTVGIGSLYWLMLKVLPGFAEFRYPSKLLAVVALGLACLGGLGLDCLAAVVRLRVPRAMGLLLALSCLGLLVSTALHHPLAEWFASFPAAEQNLTFGPLQSEAAAWEIPRALAHTSLVLGAAAASIVWAARRPRRRTALQVLLVLGTVLEMSVANRWTVISEKQSAIDHKPEVLTLIEAAERRMGLEESVPRPYRIHRTSIYTPLHWWKTASEARAREIGRWEQETIQPKHALPWGGSYVLSEGTSELFDYWFFFAPWTTDTPPRWIEAYPGTPARIIYFPRRGYDLWNTKYFVLPLALPKAFGREERGILSFLLPGTFEPVAASALDEYQILRNLQALPRAWVVHGAIWAEPIQGLLRLDRTHLMEEILYEADELWNSPQRLARDPLQTAWIETADPAALERYRNPGKTRSDEAVRITRYEPQRVELEATLHTPGFLILADVYYPGWSLAVDGRPAEILRANRLMRGVGLEAGPHHLVYIYDPASYRIGARISLAALGVLLVLGGFWALESWRPAIP